MKLSIQLHPDFERCDSVKEPRLSGDRQGIEWAIYQAVAYADVFDYPLTLPEVHRFLAYKLCSPEVVRTILEGSDWATAYLSQEQGFFTLRGREALVEIRRRRGKIAANLWPKAIRYGRQIAALPFVRMVAVTGALAVDNVEASADLDYLVITQTGRLWLCRALVILMVRWAALQGITICPNTFLSEQALFYPQHNLFTAHEMVQMVPIAGLEIYHRMRQLNCWTFNFLPNAVDPPWRNIPMQEDIKPEKLRAVAETVLSTAPGSRLEHWEMKRKLRKFSRRNARSAEAAFSADWCKGHFDNHGQRTLAAYYSRLEAFKENNGPV